MMIACQVAVASTASETSGMDAAEPAPTLAPVAPVAPVGPVAPLGPVGPVAAPPPPVAVIIRVATSELAPLENAMHVPATRSRPPVGLAGVGPPGGCAR